MTEGEQGSADTFSEHFMAQEAEEDGSEEDSSKIMNFVEVKCEPPSPDIDHEEEMPDDFQHQENKTAALIEEEPGQFPDNNDTAVSISSCDSTESDKKHWICLYCEDIFVSADFLASHVKTVHPGLEVVFTPFPDRSLQSCDTRGTDKKNCICSYCESTFVGSGFLETHIRTEHPDKNVVYKCGECNRVFPQSWMLSKHVLPPPGDLFHCCQLCYENFRNAEELTRHHVSKHMGGKRYKCPHCGKAYKKPSQLKIHLPAHTGEKPYTCQICNKCFSFPAALSIHRSKEHPEVPRREYHTEKKKYPCPHCDKSFQKPSHLKIHLPLHTGERPYHCSECGMSFSFPAAFSKHKLKHAQNPAKYSCDECGREFLIRSRLIAHFAKHMEAKSYSCERCDMTFKSQFRLDMHLSSHQD
ncbi:zinc finger protein 708 isoform X1 [Anabrus simplex]|uniref:zinc finger protein 708 isoform X1 n=1 Tax=Anabrus simplex TaxID=316456 RepID=UPI0034DDBC00